MLATVSASPEESTATEAPSLCGEVCEEKVVRRVGLVELATETHLALLPLEAFVKRPASRRSREAESQDSKDCNPVCKLETETSPA